MSAFFLTFLAVTLAMVPGREAVRAARLAAVGAKQGVLLVVVLLAAAVACAVMAWLAGTFDGLLSELHERWFVAAALGLAALEVLFLGPPKSPVEPTHSLGAVALVVFAGVFADASGLLVLSLGVMSGSPALAALGGALAAAGVLGFAVSAAEDWEKLPSKTLRRAAAGILLIGAVIIAYSA